MEMWFKFLILGVIIGSNNFATALALGSLGQRDRWRQILSVFALFEFGIPLVGLWLGRHASQMISGQIDWLGPTLLAGLGIWTIFETTRDSRTQEKLARWLTSWRGLFLLSAGLSVDNLIVGFGLGLSGFQPFTLATIIMIFSVTFAWIGLQLGERVRHNYETQAELLAGCLLLGLAYADWAGIL